MAEVHGLVFYGQSPPFGLLLQKSTFFDKSPPSYLLYKTIFWSFVDETHFLVFCGKIPPSGLLWKNSTFWFSMVFCGRRSSSGLLWQKTTFSPSMAEDHIFLFYYRGPLFPLLYIYIFSIFIVIVYLLILMTQNLLFILNNPS